MIYVVTGAAGSGKSEFAEKLVTALAERDKDCFQIYAATMINDGQEAAKRIQRHKNLRAGKGFLTWEAPFGMRGLPKVWQKEKKDIVKNNPDMIILLECMSNLLANLMFEKQMSGKEACLEILSQIKETPFRHLVVVTNEIFSDGAFYEGKMQEYQQALGWINQCLLQQADAACEVVYSIPVFLKGEALCPC